MFTLLYKFIVIVSCLEKNILVYSVRKYVLGQLNKTIRYLKVTHLLKLSIIALCKWTAFPVVKVASYYSIKCSYVFFCGWGPLLFFFNTAHEHLVTLLSQLSKFILGGAPFCYIAGLEPKCSLPCPFQPKVYLLIFKSGINIRVIYLVSIIMYRLLLFF